MLFKAKKDNNKESNATKTKNKAQKKKEELILTPEIKKAIDRLDGSSFNLVFSDQKRIQKEMKRLQRSTKKLSHYIDLLISGHAHVAVSPSSKSGILLWNNKMEEAGRTDLVLDKNNKKIKVLYDYFNNKKDDSCEVNSDSENTEPPFNDSNIIIMPETEEGAIIVDDESIVYDPVASEHPTDEEDNESEVVEPESSNDESFDANTGFIDPKDDNIISFKTVKTSAITFDNEKLKSATFDEFGNLVSDEDDTTIKSYKEFLDIYPQLNLVYDSVKMAGLNIYFKKYMKDGEVIQNLLKGIIINSDDEIIRKIIIDINKIYGNGIVILLNDAEDLLDCTAVPIYNTDDIMSIICHQLSDDEIARVSSWKPDFYKYVISRTDMSSLRGKRFTKDQYIKLMAALNSVYKECEDKSYDVCCRFRFDRYKSIDNFQLICDEWVTLIPNTEIIDKNDISSKRFWISYNGKKKVGERIITGYLEIPRTDSDLNPDNK